MGSQALGIKVQRLSVNNHQRVAIIAPVLFRTRAKQQTSHPMCWHGFVGKGERRHRLWKRLRPHESRPWRWSDRREGEEGRHFVCRKENQETTTFRAVDALATEVFRVIFDELKEAEHRILSCYLEANNFSSCILTHLYIRPFRLNVNKMINCFLIVFVDWFIYLFRLLISIVWLKWITRVLVPCSFEKSMWKGSLCKIT